MIVSVLSLLVLIVLFALIFWLAVYVLQAAGIPIPPRAIQLLGVLALLIILLWFFGGGQPVWPNWRGLQ